MKFLTKIFSKAQKKEIFEKIPEQISTKEVSLEKEDNNPVLPNIDLTPFKKIGSDSKYCKVRALIEAIHVLENKENSEQREVSHTILLNRKNKFRIIFLVQGSYFRVYLKKWENGTRFDIEKSLIDVNYEEALMFKELPWKEQGFWVDLAEQLIEKVHLIKSHRQTELERKRLELEKLEKLEAIKKKRKDS